jgi:glutaconate CoA-transferase subunit A
MEKKKAQRMDLSEAVAMIRDGDLLTFSGFTIWRRPMAAIYEMIRQGKKDLHLVEVQGGDTQRPAHRGRVREDMGVVLDRA